MNNLKTKIGLKNNLDKLLFIFSTIYLMVVVAWFWKHQNNISSSNVTNVNQESVNNDTQTLDTNNNAPIPIDNINLAPLNTQTNQLPPPPSISSLPQPSINLNTANNSLNIPPLPNTDISSNNLLPPPPLVSPLPISQPPQPKLSPPPVSSNSQVSSNITPPAPPVRPKPTSSSVTKLTKVPTINSLNVNTENNNKIPSGVSISPQSLPQTKYNYTLMGVVELGNTSSVALFNINNSTEKVQVGSEIGTTGWVLMGLNNTQAVITRQNQSVYLRVGETF